MKATALTKKSGETFSRPDYNPFEVEAAVIYLLIGSELLVLHNFAVHVNFAAQVTEESA